MPKQAETANDLPKGWNIVQLKEILKVKHGKNQNDVVSSEGNYPILGSGGQIGKATKYLYDKPSVLIGRKGTINVPRFIETPFWTIDTLFYTEISPLAFPRFVYYMFKTIDWYSYNEASGVPSLSSSTIESIKVTLPPLLEQQRISRVLQSVDVTLEAARETQAQAQRLRDKVGEQLLTQKKYTNHKLRDICIKVTDGTHQSVKLSEQGTIPFLYISSVGARFINWKTENKITSETHSIISKGRETKSGLILYTAVGSYGYAARVRVNRPFGFQRHIAYVLPDEQKVNPDFLEIYLNSATARQYADSVAVGNAQKTVTLGELAKFPIPLPPLPEQQRIVSILETFDQRLSAASAYVCQLEQLKKKLLQALLTGQVRVPMPAKEQP